MASMEQDEKPHIINVHQFFPALSNGNEKPASGRLGENPTGVMDEDEECNFFTKQTAGVSSTTKDRTVAEDDNRTGLRSQGDDDKGKATLKGGGDATSEGAGVVESAIGPSANHNAPSSESRQSQGDRERSPNSISDWLNLSALPTVGGIFTADEWHDDLSACVKVNSIVSERALQHYRNAVDLHEGGRIVESITAVSKAISLKEDEAVFYCQRAESFLLLCDFKSAVANYTKACGMLPSNADAGDRLAFICYLYGQCQAEQHMYSEALELFSRAAALKPDDVFYNTRMYGEGLAVAGRLVKTEVRNPDLYLLMSRLHERLHEMQQCYYDVQKALSIDESHSEATRRMAGLVQRADEHEKQAVRLGAVGKHTDALRHMSAAIEINPSVCDFYILRGGLNRQLNNFTAAIDDIQLALNKCGGGEQHPTCVRARRQLVLAYNDFAVRCSSNGLHDEAIFLLNSALEGETNEKGIYVNRGDCFLKQGNLTFALQDYLQGHELDQSDSDISARLSAVYHEIGLKFYRMRNYAVSEVKFTQALQHNDTVGQYHISRCRARYMLQNLGGARQDFLHGLLLDPTNESILSTLSLLFPGKSVAAVMGSPAVRSLLNKLGSVACQTALSPISGLTPCKPSVHLCGPAGSRMRAARGDVTVHNHQASSNMRDFSRALLLEKKQVDTEVKDALVHRTANHRHGSITQPLPPVKPSRCHR